MDADAKRLAEMGYSQDLNRSWSGFSNFAISFSIISILAGCFTNFGAGWNNGGPISISWSWPIISAFILLIGFTMSELVSAYPTSGGIYWWASKLGGPRAGFYTGWLNLIGLVAVTAGVSYGCATFIDLTISTWSEDFAADYSLTRVFVIFVIVLAIASVLNIFSGHLMAIMNNVSVWWHVAGAAAIVLILLIVPDTHQSFSYVFTERINNSGYSDGSVTSGHVLLRGDPVRLPADAVHDHRLRRLCAPERGDQGRLAWGPPRASGSRSSTRRSAATSCCSPSCSRCRTFPTGIPTTRSAPAASRRSSTPRSAPTGPAPSCSSPSAGQLFCAVSCMTSASRMTYAFSRDRAVPGSTHWSQLSANRVPARAVMLVAVLAALVTLPALVEVNIGTEEAPIYSPIAFFAVTSIAVLGLYLSFAIPIWLRWRHGENFEVGEWNNGSKYKWMNPIAVAEIVIVSLYLMMPTYKPGNPFDENFEWKFVNYSPIVTLGALLAITIWWQLSAKNWFKGPIRTIDSAEDSA